MKKFTAVLFVIIMIFSLFSCSVYKGSYNATMLVKSSWGNQCEVDFGSLEGTLVMNVTARKVNYDGMIEYNAELEEGELSVYYDVDGTKELLFTIKGGEKLDSRGGKVEKGDKVTIIIETNGTAKNGEIEIEFD